MKTIYTKLTKNQGRRYTDQTYRKPVKTIYTPNLPKTSQDNMLTKLTENQSRQYTHQNLLKTSEYNIDTKFYENK